MKSVAGLVCGLLFTVSAVLAETEIRMWSAADGSSTVEASLVDVGGGNVGLRKKDGSKITVPISKLSKEDQNYIDEYLKQRKEAEVVEEPAAVPLNLPYEQGKVVGPIEAASDSHYLLYIPRSLKAGREVPLLFFTHSMGGSSYLLDQIVEGAEMNGWIMAISIESKNGRGEGENLSCSEHAVDHILDTLPVDKDRLYFTGNSGGAASACVNYEQLDGYGLMPCIGYLPSGVPTPSGDCFIINGANDYNRYVSASLRKDVGKVGVQRFFEGGHNDAPGWLMTEGMTWLEGRFLAKKGRRFQEEQLDYENAVIEWIGRLKEKEPYRAYYWACFLQEELKLTERNAARVAALVKELGADSTNRLYVEALDEIDQFAVKVLSAFGSQSLYDHTDPSITAKCRDMLRDYQDVPVIAGLIEALSHKTVGN